MLILHVTTKVLVVDMINVPLTTTVLVVDMINVQQRYW